MLAAKSAAWEWLQQSRVGWEKWPVKYQVNKYLPSPHQNINKLCGERDGRLASAH